MVYRHAFSRVRVALLSTALLLAACTEAATQTQDANKNGKAGAEAQQAGGTTPKQQGAFSLTVPEEAVGLLDKLTIKITGPDGAPISETSQDVKGGESLSFPLDVGSYKVAVEAFLGGVLMFTGAGSTEIKVGEKSLLDVVMVAAEAAQADGKGELEIHLKIPGVNDGAVKPEDDAAADDEAKPDEAADDAAEDDAKPDDAKPEDADDNANDDDAGPDQADDAGGDGAKPEEQPAQEPAATDDVVKSLVGEWNTSYHVGACTSVTVKIDATKIVFSDDSGVASNAPITVDYKYADGVLFISKMETANPDRHLARVVATNIGRSIDVRPAKDGAISVEIKLPSKFLRDKVFTKVD